MSTPKLKYDAEKFQKVAGAYLMECETNGKFPTKGGLFIALDISSQTYFRYKKVKKDKALKRAINLVESAIEEVWVQALPSKEKSVAGVIFYLKNAFAWRDKKETELSTKDGKPLKISIIKEIDKVYGDRNTNDGADG